MTPFVVAMAGLCLGTLAVLLWPLFRRRSRTAEPRAAYDLRLYRDQLAEVERDRMRGLLGSEDAEAARTEVKRRMLAAAEAKAASAAAPVSVRGRRNWAAAAVIAVLLPATAALLYFALGTPGVPDQPLAMRRGQETLAAAQGGEPGASLPEAAAQLAKQLETRADDAAGWFLLGRAYLEMERFADAVRALGRARALAPGQPEVAGAYAEAAIAAAGGRIDDTARQALRTLLTLDPISPQARFLLALDRAQQGDLPAALQAWTDLLALSPVDAPWLATVREHIDRAARQAGIDPAIIKPSAEALALAAAATPSAESAGPNDADVAAAAQMRPEDREEMIRGMVERLAARLRETPDDIEGWRRLAQAYDVLQEPAKAEEARARIAALGRR